MNKNDLLTRSASEAFRNKNYLEALRYYVSLSSKISPRLYYANLSLCLTRLGCKAHGLKSSSSYVYLEKCLIEASKTFKVAQRFTEENDLLSALAESEDASPFALKASFWAGLRAKDYEHSRLLITRISNLRHDSGIQSWIKDAERSLNKAQPKIVDLEAEITSIKSTRISSIPSRVCYFLHNSLPYSSGGYATRAHGLAQGLAATGLDVICITRPGFPADLTGSNFSDIPIYNNINGLRYQRILNPSRKDNSEVQYIMKSRDSISSELRNIRPSLVLAASNYATAMPALMAAKELGIPFIYEVRGFWEVTRVSREPEYELSNHYQNMVYHETLVCNHADHVFTLTNPMKDELIKRGVSSNKISIVPNSCDPTVFKAQERDQQLAVHYGIRAEDVVIGYIGSFVQYEGLDDLVASCEVLAKKNLHFKLLIVGNENVSSGEKGPITSEIIGLASKYNLRDHLIMPGRIPHDQVASHYSLIDIAPFPRKPQPVTEMVSPMKPLEAFAMEKAVVVSSVKALQEMVIDNKTGLVYEKGRIESLSDALEKLILDPVLRGKLGKAAKTWLEKERTWEKTSLQASSIIAGLTG